MAVWGNNNTKVIDVDLPRTRRLVGDTMFVSRSFAAMKRPIFYPFRLASAQATYLPFGTYKVTTSFCLTPPILDTPLLVPIAMVTKRLTGIMYCSS